jgi:hypothetical protein
MEKNNTSKYLKYAIGEIVLVVFGILIALQINNWNENRVAQQRIDSRLINLTKDIESDIAEINDILQISKDRIIIVKSILQGTNRLGSFGIFEEPFFEPTTETYQNPNVKMSMLRTLDGDGPIFNELINSGEFYLIKDTLLANKIQKYYSTVDEIKDLEYWNNNQSHINIIKSKNRLGLGTGSRDGTMEKLIELVNNDHQFGAELEHEYTVTIQQYNLISQLKLQALDLKEAIESRKINK